MPKRAAASTLVVAATKCSATLAAAAFEEPGLRGRRVGHGLLGGEGLAGDDEERLGRCDAAQHRGDVVAVDVGDEVQVEPRMGERRERRDRHLRPEVAAADADVDDVAQRPRAALGPRPHRLGEGEHRLAGGLDLVGERRRARRRAQGGVQHRPAFGEVDRLAGEHRVAPGLDAAFARQVGEEVQRRRVDAVLRQVAEHFGRLDAEALEARRVAGEGLAQVEIATVGFEVAAQGGPGGGGVATRERGHGIQVGVVEEAGWPLSAGTIATPCLARRRPASSPGCKVRGASAATTKIGPSAVSKVYSRVLPR